MVRVWSLPLCHLLRQGTLLHVSRCINGNWRLLGLLDRPNKIYGEGGVRGGGGGEVGDPANRISLESHPVVVVMLLVASCWVHCDELASHPGGVVMLLVASCWGPCDELACHPGGIVILLVVSYWVPCDGLAFHPGE